MEIIARSGSDVAKDGRGTTPAGRHPWLPKRTLVVHRSGHRPRTAHVGPWPWSHRGGGENARKREGIGVDGTTTDAQLIRREKEEQLAAQLEREGIQFERIPEDFYPGKPYATARQIARTEQHNSPKSIFVALLARRWFRLFASPASSFTIQPRLTRSSGVNRKILRPVSAEADNAPGRAVRPPRPPRSLRAGRSLHPGANFCPVPGI